MEKIKKFKIIEIVLIIFVPLLIGSLLFVTPWNGDLNLIDEGQFGAWAWYMTQGKLMFRDIYITYGPLYVYPLYLLFKFIGMQVFYIRLIYGALGSMISVFFVMMFVSRLKLKYVVSLIFLLLILLIPGMNWRQGIIYISLLVIITAFEKKSNVLSFLSGILTVISFLITPDAGMYTTLILVIFYLYYFIFSKNIKKVLGMFLMTFSGILISIGLFYLWSSYEGWFKAYVETTLDVLRSFSGTDLPNGKAFPNILPRDLQFSNLKFFIKYILSQDMLLYWELLLYVITMLYLLERKVLGLTEKTDKIILIVTFLGIISYYSLIGRSGNFFLGLTPVLIIFAYFFNKFLKVYQGKLLLKKLNILFMVVMSLFIMRVLYIFHTHIPDLFGIKHETNAVTIPNLGSIQISSEQAVYLRGIQDYVYKYSNSSDKVFFLSNEPMMYLFTKRLNPTRYDLPYVAHTIDKRYEVLDSLKKNLPKLIFYDLKSWPVDEIDNKTRLPEIVEFINKNYTKQHILNGRVEVFSLKKI